MLESRGVDDPEIQQRLVATIFTRISSVVMATVCELIVGATAMFIDPHPIFMVWIALCFSLLLIRLALLAWSNREAANDRSTPTALAIGLSLAWISVIGFGCLICDLSGDPALQVLSNVCVTAILGGLIARNASTPRLALTQAADPAPSSPAVRRRPSRRLLQDKRRDRLAAHGASRQRQPDAAGSADRPPQPDARH